MTKSVIHINRQNIVMNAKDGKNRPCITVKSDGYKKARYAHDVDILGPSRVVGTKDPLKCGARVWIETESEIVLKGETTFSGSRDV